MSPNVNGEWRPRNKWHVTNGLENEVFGFFIETEPHSTLHWDGG
jgi:hypothetical protein